MKEYVHWAPTWSYLYDGLEALKQQINSADVPIARRESMFTVLRYLSEVYCLGEDTLDLLKYKGARGRDAPHQVEAVYQTVMGTAGLPISSATVLDAIRETNKAHIGQLMKQGAQEMAKAAVPHGKPSTSGAQ